MNEIRLRRTCRTVLTR